MIRLTLQTSRQICTATPLCTAQYRLAQGSALSSGDQNEERACRSKIHIYLIWRWGGGIGKAALRKHVCESLSIRTGLWYYTSRRTLESHPKRASVDKGQVADHGAPLGGSLRVKIVGHVVFDLDNPDWYDTICSLKGLSFSFL